MEHERFPGRILERVRAMASTSLPDFIQNIKPLPSDTALNVSPLYRALVNRPGHAHAHELLNKYLFSLGLNGQQKDYVHLTLHHLAIPTINDKRVFDMVTLEFVRKFVKAGLLEYLDFFHDDIVRREVARKLLGI